MHGIESPFEVRRHDLLNKQGLAFLGRWWWVGKSPIHRVRRVTVGWARGRFRFGFMLVLDDEVAVKVASVPGKAAFT